MTTNEQEAARWNQAGATEVTPKSVAASRTKADEMLHKAEHYDYNKQAWIGTDGRYLCCAHPADMNCNCYGRLHYGELARRLR